MKLIKIIGHPALVISLFLLVIIEGDHFGGFYLLYLLFGLMYGAPFALAALAGIAAMTLALNLGAKAFVLNTILHFVGWLLLLASYTLFFMNSQNNHAGTFQTAISLVGLALFSLSSFCFLIRILLRFTRPESKEDKVLRAF